MYDFLLKIALLAIYDIYLMNKISSIKSDIRYEFV